MGLFTRRPDQLEASARALNLRADQLDRMGKHGAAAVKRKQATKIATRAAHLATPQR